MPEVTQVPPEWLDLSVYQRDVLLTVRCNQPIGFDALFEAVGGVKGRTSENYCQQVLDGLRADGLLARDPGHGYGVSAAYRLTDAGEARVDAMQELLWTVATA